MDDRITIDDDAVEARLREKAESRKDDFERLNRGEVTAEELQRENSIFPEGWVVANCSLDWDVIGR
ncbi:MAG: hypothetical protein P1U89_22200 [Verrucomicrobiales bacterium]|nr:hypothetical protein [Verrucomicrobiales bacterium]MDF1814037.1 hypothetical protein [Verrucomicrobiales bacterium]